MDDNYNTNFRNNTNIQQNPQQPYPAGNNAAQNPYAAQQPAAGAPAKAPANVAGGEMFVGLNILSKIGVIFIIIGVIAFTAVSEGYLSGEVRGGLMYLVGALMAGAGEFFYRKKSAVFARALTLGALVEWSVAVLVSYYSLEAFGCVGAIVGAALTAAIGVLFAWRYDSRMVLCTALVCTVPPFFAEADARTGLIAGAAVVLLTQAAAYILSHRKNRQCPLWTGFACSFVLTWAVIFVANRAYRSDILPVLAISVGFTLLAYGLIIAAQFVRSMRNGGELEAGGGALLVLSAVFSGLFTLMILWTKVSRETGGTAVLCLAAVMAVLAIAAKLRYDRNKLTIALVNTVLAFIPIGLFALVNGRWFIVALTVYGTALALAGLYADRKYLRVWGCSVLGTSEFLFLTVGLLNSGSSAFPVQFGVNAAAFIALMICWAAKGHRSPLFSTYSALAILNAGFFGVYLIYDNLTSVSSTDMGGGFYAAAFSALLWLALGFTAGKLSFMGKGAGISALLLDFLGLCWLLGANIASARITPDSVGAIVLVILANIVSLASVLDAVKRIEALSGRTVRSVALIVSSYGLFITTLVLGVNNWVTFTSCIISIVYLLTAAAWITYGFLRERPLTRRFGLALALLSSAKLFLIDFSGINAMGRTLMFIGFGITLLCISFAYGFFEHKMKK